MRTAEFLFFILLIFATSGVQTVAGDYTINPHTDDQNLIDKGLIDSKGADSTITFWELPLWIQIFYISGLFAVVFGIFKTFPFIFGRIRGHLENSNRNGIYEYVLENPGSNIAEVSKNLKLNRGSVKYHISILYSEKKITTVKTGKSIQLFNNSNSFDEHEKLIISCLRDEHNKMILKSILEKPGITNQDLTEIFNLNKSTIHWYLKKFQHSQIIMYVMEGKYKKWFINPIMEPDLRKYI